jgi:phenylalanyl-tRNA synthetase alpha chain
VTELLKALGALPPDEKKSRGALINAAKQQVESALTARRHALAEAELEQQLKSESLDVTLPGRRRGDGAVHPIIRMMERIEQIFGSMGFDVADGPEIETDWYNFTALNSPENHPARSMQVTYYVDMKDAEGRWLNLRTHTSPMQIRYARAHAKKYASAASMPDIRVIAPGRTYRVDSDATHSPMFHQVEGLWVGENVSFKDLKVMYLDFIQAFFETTELKLRFRPSYFPFTEPSAEIDIMFEHGPLAGRWLEVRCIRRSSATWGWTPSDSSASPSARASTGSRCCATASATCACSSTATCASCPSSSKRNLEQCNSQNRGCASSATRRSPRPSWPTC